MALSWSSSGGGDHSTDVVPASDGIFRTRTSELQATIQVSPELISP
jgi:hypothetical protein